MECKGWHQEAALRMLRNNLHPEVAERPQDLIVYGGTGKAARNHECYRAIEATLKRLANDETLLVQSGKPVGVLRTHDEAPRVLIANANLVPRWATWDEFRRLEALGLTMYGQMTAGSWIYIGTQGILQGSYEMCTDLDDALERVTAAKRKRGALSVGLLGNVADVLPELARRGVAIDVLTDQTAAHDLRVGYIPRDHTVESAAEFRERDAAG